MNKLLALGTLLLLMLLAGCGLNSPQNIAGSKADDQQTAAVTVTLWELEYATLSGGAKMNTNHSGYSAGGFVDGFINNTTAKVDFTINAPAAGSYSLALRYSAGNGTSTNTGLYVNGSKLKNITCNATANWDTWADETEMVWLNAGNNTLSYKADISSGSCINLDKVTATSASPTSYTVTFNSQGGSAVATQVVASGNKAISPTNPTLSGYTFGGWYKEASCINPWNFSTDVVTSNITLYAKWTPTVSVILWELEYATLSGGAKMNTNHSGYSAGGFVDGFINNTTAKVDFTINAPAAGSYSLALRYSAGNGTSNNTGLYVNGSKLKNITCNATANWDTWADETEMVWLNAGNNTLSYKADISSGSCINLDKVIATSALTTSYTVTFNSLGGSAVATQVVTSGNKATQPAAPTLSGYVFGGWYKEASCINQWNFSTDVVTSNITLYAKWTSTNNTITIEAENAVLSGGANKNTNHSGYSGSGFVDGFINNTTADVDFVINVAAAGSYKLTLRYSAGNGTSANTGLYVNGNKVKNITCNATASWDTWADEIETVSLNAGNNVISYKADISSGSCINFDKITLPTIGCTPPTIINNPVSQGVCSGSSVNLSVTASGAASYQWYMGTPGSGTSIPGANAPSYVATVSGSYYCVVSSSGGCSVTSNAATATIGTVPIVTIYPTDVSLCGTWSTSLVVTASGGSGFQYQWYKGTPGTGTAISGAIASNYTVSTAGQYYCRVLNSTGCSVYSPVSNVSVLGFSAQPQSLTICEMSQVSMSVVAPGPVQYQWYSSTGGKLVDSKYYTGTQTSKLNFLYTPAAMSGGYYCVVSNSLGCAVVSSIGQLTIIPMPTKNDIWNSSWYNHQGAGGNPYGNFWVQVDPPSGMIEYVKITNTKYPQFNGTFSYTATNWPQVSTGDVSLPAGTVTVEYWTLNANGCESMHSFWSNPAW